MTARVVVGGQGTDPFSVNAAGINTDVSSHLSSLTQSHFVFNVASQWTMMESALCLKTGPLRIIWHNFTNSQRLLIIFGRQRPYSILNWYDRKFLKWFRIRCVVGHSNSSDLTHLKSEFLGWLRTACYRQGNKRVGKRVGLCQGRKTALPTLVVTFDIAHCSDRNTVCLKDLTFPSIRQHQLWNDASLRMVTASAWYTAVKTTVFY